MEREALPLEETLSSRVSEMRCHARSLRSVKEADKLMLQQDRPNPDGSFVAASLPQPASGALKPGWSVRMDKSLFEICFSC